MYTVKPSEITDKKGNKTFVYYHGCTGEMSSCVYAILTTDGFSLVGHVFNQSLAVRMEQHIKLATEKELREHLLLSNNVVHVFVLNTYTKRNANSEDVLYLLEQIAIMEVAYHIVTVKIGYKPGVKCNPNILNWVRRYGLNNFVGNKTFDRKEKLLEYCCGLHEDIRDFLKKKPFNFSEFFSMFDMDNQTSLVG